MKTANSPGAKEVDSIRNFAPLPQNQNTVAKATSCSTKIAQSGIYDLYGQQAGAHPYCQWLCANQANYAVALDDQTMLERNSQPPVGDERVEHIAQWLQLRL